MTAQQTMNNATSTEPTNGDNNNGDQQPDQTTVKTTVKRSNTTLWVMIILFALPNLAAFYFYFNRDTIDFSSLTTNTGTIISPVRQLPDVTLTKIDGTAFQTASLKGKWIMVSVGSSNCKQDCQDNLYKMRQVRKATGEFYKRVDRLFLLTDTDNLETFQSLLTKEYPKLTVVKPPAGTEGLQTYESLFALLSVKGELVQDGIYFIDPLGNYMMAFPAQSEAKNILKDLMRLLKISQIG